MFETLLEYQSLTRRASDAMSELKAEATEFAEENRNLQEGDVVEVIDIESGEFLVDGVIGRCKNMISSHLRQGSSTILLDHFENDRKKFDEDWALLRYEIFGKKKDGTASLKHCFYSPHFMVWEEDYNKLPEKRKYRFDYFIRLKK
jgi:hypothetical protein